MIQGAGNIKTVKAQQKWRLVNIFSGVVGGVGGCANASSTLHYFCFILYCSHPPYMIFVLLNGLIFLDLWL
jgi:hypothetical protein